MLKFLKISLLVIIVGLMPSSSFASLEQFWQGSNNELQWLTEKEQEWLNEHPVIRVGNELYWPPFNSHIEGKPSGLSIAYIQLLAGKLGLELDFGEPRNFGELLDAAKQRQLDVMLNIVDTPDRADYLLFTQPYYSNVNVIVSSITYPLSSLAELSGKKVAFPKGGFYDEYFRANNLGVTPLPVADSQASIEMLVSGEADAALGQEAVMQYLLDQLNIDDFALSGFAAVSIEAPDLRIAVRSDWPILHSILVKTMQRVSPAEVQALQQKWIGATTSPSSFDTYAQTPTERHTSSWTALVLGAIVLLLMPVIALRLILKRQDLVTEQLLRKRSVLRRVALVISALYLVIVVTLTWITLERIEQNIRTQEVAHLATFNKSSEQSLLTWVRSQQNSIQDLSRSDAARAVKNAYHANPALLKQLFVQEFEKERSDLLADNLSLVTADGETLTTLNEVWSIDWSQPKRRQQLTQATAARGIYVPPDTAGTTQNERSLLHFIVTISVVDDKPLYLIASFNSATSFSQFTELSRLSPTVDSYIIDGSGNALTTPRYAEYIGPYQGQTGYFAIRDPRINLEEKNIRATEYLSSPLTLAAQSLSQEQSGLSYEDYRDYRGVNVLGSWLWLPDLQLGIISEVDSAHALADFTQIRYVVMGMLLIVLFVTFEIGVVLITFGEKVNLRLRNMVQQRSSELQSALTQLEAAEQSRTTALEAAEIGVWNINLTTHQWWWDERSSEILGITAETASPESLGAILIPSQRENLWLRFKEVAASGESFDVEFEIVRDDQKHGFVRARGRAKRSESGQVYINGILTDVTELKNTQKSIRDIRQRNELILNSAGEGIIGLDRDGTITFSNLAACELLQYSETELVGANLHQLAHFAHADGQAYAAADCPMGRAANSGTSAQVQNEVLWRKDGVAFPVEYSAVPLQQDGELIGAVIVFRDVSERIEQQRQIAQSERQVRSILEASPDPLIIVDEAAKIVSINLRTEELLGYHRDELIGKPVEVLIPHRFRKHHVGLRNAFIQKPEARLFARTSKMENFWALKKDGSEFPIELSLNPVETDEGTFLVSALHDISERLAAERALKNSEERLQAAAAAAGIGLWDYIPDTGQIFTNENSVEILGFAASDVLDPSSNENNSWRELRGGLDRWLEHIYPDDKAHVATLFTEQLAGASDSFASEYRIKSDHNGWHWVSAAGRVIERDTLGRPLRFVGIIRDVTEEKLLKQELIDVEVKD